MALKRASYLAGVAVRRFGSVVRDPSNQGHWLELLKRVARLRLAVARGIPIEFPFLNGTRLRCWTDTHLSRNLAFYRIPDYPPMLFMLAYLRPGDNVIDVGANVGLYSVVAASLTRPGGRVDAVEAVPQTALRLRTGSVLLTSFFHAGINCQGLGVLPMLVLGVSPVLGGVTGLVGIAVFAAVGAWLLAGCGGSSVSACPPP